MNYQLLTVNQQAQILRGFMESAEADHFRATVQRNAAVTLPEGTGNVDGLDQQIAATQAQWQAAKDALDALSKPVAEPVTPGVPDTDQAAATAPHPETPTEPMDPPAPVTA